MSGESWTPGPWLAAPNSCYWEVIPETPGENGKPHSLGEVCASDVNNRDGGLQEANAWVMAAAPEMYAALKHAACPDCDGSGNRQTPDGIEPCGWCAQREQALAKARGETDGSES